MASNALNAVMAGMCMGSVSDGGSVAMVLSGATIASCPSSLSTTSVQRGACPGAQKGETRMDAGFVVGSRGKVRRQGAGDELHERPYPPGILMPLGINGMDVRIGRVALRQDLYKPSALQIPLDVPLGAHQNAVTVQCPIHSYFAVVGRQDASGFDELGGTESTTATCQAPRPIGFIPLANTEAVMPCQVARNFGQTMLGDIHRRRAQKTAIGGDLPGDAPGIRGRAKTNADIECVLGQRRWIYRQLKLHFNAGMPKNELCNEGRDMTAAETGCRIHSQQPPGGGCCAMDQLLQAVDVAEDSACMLQIHLSLRGETHAARRAVYQSHAHARLHRCQMLADRRRRNAQFTSSSAQAASGCKCGEKAKIGWLDAAATHDVLSLISSKQWIDFNDVASGRPVLTVPLSTIRTGTIHEDIPHRNDPWRRHWQRSRARRPTRPGNAGQLRQQFQV